MTSTWPVNENNPKTSLKRLCLLQKLGAGERSRTPDRLITSQLLYQLSYASSAYTASNEGGILDEVP